MSIYLLLYLHIRLLTEVRTNKMPSVGNSSNGCLNCAIARKSGKRSCCARGGTWFKNCGDAGDPQFDHTWAEGIQTCKNVGSSASVESSRKVMHHDAGVDQSPNATHLRNTTQKQMIISHSARISSTDDAGAEGCVELARGCVYICCCFIIVTLADLASIRSRMHQSRHIINL